MVHPGNIASHPTFYLHWWLLHIIWAEILAESSTVSEHSAPLYEHLISSWNKIQALELSTPTLTKQSRWCPRSGRSDRDVMGRCARNLESVQSSAMLRMLRPQRLRGSSGQLPPACLSNLFFYRLQICLRLEASTVKLFARADFLLASYQVMAIQSCLSDRALRRNHQSSRA